MTRAGLRRLAAPLAATLAVAYLAAMVVTGAQPVQRQLVRFEAKGVLQLAPEEIRRVSLSRGGRAIALVRSGDRGWTTAAGAAVSPAAVARVDAAVKMMHRSGPVRVIGPEELARTDARQLGLDPPGIVAALFGSGDGAVLTARFGGPNPEGFLQYMRVDGQDRLYLMSRFVGAEWLAAFEAATAP